ncbi:alpha/beta hydrolase-fold protein [Microbacterium sp. BK668]|uniref:alpha/beta hydrolase-fold protein n=1 Tax=Microbacterium sp. BK668 TaxID=2512118 RepID=UPI001414CEE2|nr:alpha/beta hydrolase-fold protein [Microbacterium sp. BK668]
MTTAAALGVSTLLAAQPAAAAEDPWVAEVDNVVPDVYRFSVPDSAIQPATGINGSVVAVEGNFAPGKTWTTLNMGSSNTPNGRVWSTTLGPLEPGLYYYQYSARPAWNQDAIAFRNPASPQEVTSKPTWNTLFVDGPGAEWLADVPDGGALTDLTYRSSVTGGERSALVWTPPGYDENRAEPYPVLYLLQDEGQSYREWVELGRLKQILDNLTVDGDAEPMVVVMGDGQSDEIRGEVVKNLLPAAEGSFNISSDGDDRAIAGIGRGASQALQLQVNATGEFANVGSFSGRLEQNIGKGKARQINNATDLIRLYVGNVTDPRYNATVSLADKLAKAGVEFQSDGSDPETGGTWDTWQKNLHDFAQRVFQEPGDTGPSEGHLALEPHALPAPGTTPTPWIDENGVVTFETGTEFAGANNVTVWGNFGPAGSWPRTPMTKQPDGRWRLTMPVEAGSYYYKFVVEGSDRKDTANPTTVLSEPNWSTFQVPGGETLRGEYTTPVAPEARGHVQVMDYTSSASGNPTRSAYVWTPPDYDPERAEAYPVLYLQHGGGQTWTDWIQVGFAAQILDNYYAKGNIVPMVVVMANGNGVNFPNEITQRITVAAQAQYNVSGDPADRALAGLSMGSQAALSTMYTFPGQFAYIGAMSAFTNPPASADVTAINDGTELLRIYSGDIQDFTYQQTLGLVTALNNRGIEHEFAPIIPGPHSWDVWQKALIDFLPRLFEG